MPLKLIETSIDKIPTELRSHYVKEANGSYRLSVSDLETHLRPLKTTIAKFKLENALKSADVLPDHADMLLRRLGDRVAIETKDGETVVRIRPGTKGSLLNADGATTLEELVGAAAKEFPFLFSENAARKAPTNPTGADPKTITRSEFASLPPRERRNKVVDEKYRVVDDPEVTPRQPRTGMKEMAREQFNALYPRERAQRMREGWTLVD